MNRDRGGRIAKRLTVGAGAALGATVLFAPAAQADTFTVNSLDDPGDGTCDAAECTLREAIEDSNNYDGFDQVVFEAGLSGTITLTDGRLNLYGDAVEIVGPGQDLVDVSGDDASRIFYINLPTDGDDVSIYGLTLRNGYYDGHGGAIYNANAELTIGESTVSDSYANDEGGAIYGYTDSDLSLRQATLTGNSAGNAGGAVSSYYHTSVEVRRSTITDNYSGGSGGGIYLYGFDDDGNSMALVVDRSTISGNTADDDGGGIYVGDYIESATIRDSTISDNQAGDDGGGIYVNSTDGLLTISGSTVSGNAADDDGGGAYLYDFYSGEGGRAVLENSTFSYNTAAGDGGGIYIDDLGRGRLDSLTITGNTALGAGGGVYFDNGENSAQARNVIIANSGGGGDLATEEAAGDPTGVPLRFEFSLIEDPGDAAIQETGPNVLGQDPQLGPLADNGGFTQTHLPALTSPAIDQGDSGVFDLDQRGQPRPVDFPDIADAIGGDGADIGAVERAFEPPAPAVEDCQGTPVPSLFGTDSDDALAGTEAPEAIHGLGGNDTISSATGADCLYGEGGNDKLKGGGGKDLAQGGAGDDKLVGGGGKDKLQGQDGEDRLRGSEGADRLVGGAGGDRLKGAGGDDKLVGGPGPDRFSCGAGKKDVADASPGEQVADDCEKVK